jgi:hypothetical protein
METDPIRHREFSMVHLLSRPVAALAAATMTLTTAIATITLTASGADGAPAASAPGATRTAQDQARRAFAAMPLAFEANRGQSDRRVRYLARGDGFNLFLTPHRAVFGLRGAAVALKPVGAARSPRLVGGGRRAATTSYFRGDDPSRWQRGVPTFGRVRYEGLYRGIDMVVRGDRSGAEYDYVVAPGSDPDRIGYRLEGADGLRLRGGDLVARTAAGDFVHHAPVAYQQIDGRRRPVDAHFRLRHGVVSFVLGSYDRSRPLVIDPDTDIDYATFLGGDGDDGGSAIAVDGNDVYVTGYTASADFPPTTGAYDTSVSDGTDVFLTRITPNGEGTADLVYSTYLGGAGPTTYDNDWGLGIAVAGGDAYLTGYTTSADFPTTAGALDTTLGGASDGFLTRISPDGAGAADLVYSTFVGGSGADSGLGIALAGGDVYLAGNTGSPDFPVTTGAFDTTLAGGDAFVTRLSPDGGGASDLVYSTYLGGKGIGDTAWGIATSGGDVYVTGQTSSSTFPTTAGAYDRTVNGETDAFVTRLSPAGGGASDLVYSTYLGAPRRETSRAIAVDAGDIYVTGWTDSGRFPTTAGAHDRIFNGHDDVFMARLSPGGAGAADLTYSTLYGGSFSDHGEGIATSGGDVYVLATADIDDKYGGSDVVVARFSPVSGGASDLVHTTWAGDDDASAGGIAVKATTAYVAGSVQGYYFSATPGAFDSTLDGIADAFVSVFDLSGDEFVWPDAWIRRAHRPNHGNDEYYGIGDQSVSTRVRRGHQRTFWVTAQNDDNAADTLTIKGAGGTASKWVIRYYRDGVDITSQVTGDGYQTASLAPGEKAQVKLTIKAKANARLDIPKRVVVKVVSATDPATYDAVEAAVTAKRR